jgi:hypothetical protein
MIPGPEDDLAAYRHHERGPLTSAADRAAGGPPKKLPRRVILLTISMTFFTLLLIAQTGGSDDSPVVQPIAAGGAAGGGAAAGGVVRVVTAADGGRIVVAESKSKRIAKLKSGAKKQVFDGASEHVCRAVRARVRARLLVDNVMWTYDPTTVKAAREAERPAQGNDADAVAQAADAAAGAATAPPHEDSAPVLILNHSVVSARLTDLASEPEHKALKAACAAADAAEGDDPAADVDTRLHFRRFDRDAAHTCLSGKYLLFYGNSNTRTLFTAFEALLRGTRQVGRLLAKQRCDNSKRNHSCSTVVSPPTALEGTTKPVELFYWGYVKDFYSETLDQKMIGNGQDDRADYVIGNAGVNVIQGTPDGQWEKGYSEARTEKLATFMRAFDKPGAQVWWHTTTRLCEHQPHFTRYKYEAKYWSGRSPAAMNSAIRKANELAVARLRSITSAPSGGSVGIVDGGALVEPDGAAVRSAHRGGVCPHYDDPLHHRFLDRELVQIFLNAWC